VKISLVIPVYNEKENLFPLYEEIKEAVRPLKDEYEIIFVNDGSKDGSDDILNKIAYSDEKVRVIHLRRNFGQTAALAAGFEFAEGEVIITMDADLQNDPNDIPRLLNKIKEGYDIVSGWRKDRKDPYFTRVIPSQIANWLISTITGVKLHDYGCTLKAYDSKVAKQLHLYGEMHRFLPALASWMGVQIAEIPVNHRPRRYGKSKYGISRTFKVLLDLLVVEFLLKYSTRPIRIFGGAGLLSFLMGFAAAFYLSVLKLVYHQRIGHRPLLLLAFLLIILGVQLISMGILGEFMTRIYFEAQGKKPYMIREVVHTRCDLKKNKSL